MIMGWKGAVKHIVIYSQIKQTLIRQSSLQIICAIIISKPYFKSVITPLWFYCHLPNRIVLTTLWGVERFFFFYVHEEWPKHTINHIRESPLNGYGCLGLTHYKDICWWCWSCTETKQNTIIYVAYNFISMCKQLSHCKTNLQLEFYLQVWNLTVSARTPTVSVKENTPVNIWT
jgi:hypothetical protein